MLVTRLVSHPVGSKLARKLNRALKSVTAVTSHVPTGPYAASPWVAFASHAVSAARSSVLFAGSKRSADGDALGDALGAAVVGTLGDADVGAAVVGDEVVGAAVVGDVDVGDAVVGDALVGAATGAATGDMEYVGVRMVSALHVVVRAYAPSAPPCPRTWSA